VALACLAVTARGLSDYAGRPLGSDCSSFYAAGRLLLAGHSPYDQAGPRAMEQSLFGAATPFYSFAYPPVFLLTM
jgi:alpha-1,2-mannosyltransferase